jgi:hypothetical protein
VDFSGSVPHYGGIGSSGARRKWVEVDASGGLVGAESAGVGTSVGASGRALPRCLVFLFFADAKLCWMVDGPTQLSDRMLSTATGLTAPKSKLGGSLLVSSVSRSRHHRAWELLVEGKVDGWRASPAVPMWRRRNDLPLPDSSPTWGGTGFPLGSNVVGCRHLFPPFLPSGSPFPHHYPSLLIIILPSPQSY